MELIEAPKFSVYGHAPLRPKHPQPPKSLRGPGLVLLDLEASVKRKPWCETDTVNSYC